MIQYLKSNCLTDKEASEIQQLEHVIHQYDQTHRWLYLSNEYNINKEMPCFFKAYSNQQMIGFGLIYADELPEVEVSILVHPDFRNQGIGVKLIKEIKKVCGEYDLNELVFKIERHFFDYNRVMFKNYDISLNSVPEYLMVWQVKNIEYKKNNQVFVIEATSKNAPLLAKQLALNFESKVETELEFVMTTLKSPSIKQYLFVNHQDEIVGSVAVDTSKCCHYLFAVNVFSGYQNKGYAKGALSQLIHTIRRQSLLPIQLQVENDNKKAIHVYQAIGFKQVSEIIELVEKKNKVFKD